MSGLNFAQVSQAASLTLLVLLGSTVASAATKTTTTVTTTNPYQVIVPKTFEYDTTGVIRTGGRSGITGPSQLAFSGVSSAVYITGSGQTIQLGQFTVQPAASTAGTAALTTYHDTPFVIQVRAPGYDKTTKIPVLSAALPELGRTFHLQTKSINSLLIRGHLDGTVNGSGSSAVTATVDSVRLGSLQAAPSGYATSYTFPVRSSDLKLPTSWTMNTTGNALASTNVATPTATATGSTATPATAAAQILTAPAAETLTATPLADPVPTPEPSTFVIFAAAAAGLAWSRRRRAARVA